MWPRAGEGAEGASPLQPFPLRAFGKAGRRDGGEVDPFLPSAWNLCGFAVHNELEKLEPDLPALPQPETSPERNGWLFDGSGGSYFERLASYHGPQKGAGNGQS